MAAVAREAALVQSASHVFGVRRGRGSVGSTGRAGAKGSATDMVALPPLHDAVAEAVVNTAVHRFPRYDSLLAGIAASGMASVHDSLTESGAVVSAVPRVEPVAVPRPARLIAHRASHAAVDAAAAWGSTGSRRRRRDDSEHEDEGAGGGGHGGAPKRARTGASGDVFFGSLPRHQPLTLIHGNASSASLGSSTSGLSLPQQRESAATPRRLRQYRQTPKNQRGVRSFVGFVNFYRGFVPLFSEMAGPLTALGGEESDLSVGEGRGMRSSATRPS